MLRAVVCDDDPYIIEWFRLFSLEYSGARSIVVDLQTFSSLPELADAIKEGCRPDILFLDVMFPEGNGIALARDIRDKIDNCKIVLVTSSEDFAMQGYEVHAYGYLLKPLKSDVVFALLDEAMKNREGKVTIRVKKLPIELNKADLTYIESDKHTLIFHTVKKDFVIYGKLDDYEEALRYDPTFVRCHQSYLVNLRFVEDIKGNFFLMKNGLSIPMRKQGAAEFKRAYYTFYFERQPAAGGDGHLK